jgi:dolichol-phosphate mannosyltransferase
LTKLSIIIPCYNEQKTLGQLVERVRAVNVDKQIIIINDASTDGSAEILAKYSDEQNFTIIHHKKNKGKGSAIRSGIMHVSGDIVIIQDADLEYDPNDYLRLIEPIINNETTVVYGSRMLNSENQKSYTRFYLGGKLVTWFTNLLYRQQLTDEPTCYKVFETGLLKSIDLKCKRFEFCPEVTAKVAKMGIKIKELPISYYPRKIEEGKKIRWYDGLEAIWILLKYRFVK